jgi:hypothetical protein
VEAGGIKSILAEYFKHNKPVYQKFKKSVTKEEGSKKRVRRDSSESHKSLEKSKKRQRTSSVVSQTSDKPKKDKKKAEVVLPPKG